jgi:hypothetical protein
VAQLKLRFFTTAAVPSAALAWQQLRVEGEVLPWRQEVVGADDQAEYESSSWGRTHVGLESEGVYGYGWLNF